MLHFRQAFFLGITLASTLFVTACSPGTRFSSWRNQTVADVMETWVNSSESKLVSSWGTPSGVFDNRDGSRLISWKNYREDSYNHGTCTQTFLIDKKGIITKWGTSGFCPDFTKLEPKNKPVPRATL